MPNLLYRYTLMNLDNCLCTGLVKSMAPFADDEVSVIYLDELLEEPTDKELHEFVSQGLIISTFTAL